MSFHLAWELSDSASKIYLGYRIGLTPCYYRSYNLIDQAEALPDWLDQLDQFYDPKKQ